MNTSELKIKLDEAEINPKGYSLNGALQPVTIVLSFFNSQWSVFHYDERGHILGLEKFETESEACENMLARLIYDKEWHKKHKLK